LGRSSAGTARTRGLTDQDMASRLNTTQSRLSKLEGTQPCDRCHCPIACDQRFSTPAGRLRADELGALAAKWGWQRLSAGAGSKGERLYDWLLIDRGADDHQLLICRSISKPSELAYYICHSRGPAPLVELVRVAGSRWGVKETFQFAKNETGLDHYQVRKYQAWYRHITLSMLAAAFLVVIAHTERVGDEKGHDRQPRTLILLS
jgi:hypothetical protein